MEWFEKIFLTSLYNNKKMVHGKICSYITDRQADICRKYMAERVCYGDYGQFSVFEHLFNGNKIQLCEAGKYNIIYW